MIVIASFAEAGASTEDSGFAINVQCRGAKSIITVFFTSLSLASI